ncbi:hypothetical protein, partial [Agaribacter flavus]
MQSWLNSHKKDPILTASNVGTGQEGVSVPNVDELSSSEKGLLQQLRSFAENGALEVEQIASILNDSTRLIRDGVEFRVEQFAQSVGAVASDYLSTAKNATNDVLGNVALAPGFVAGVAGFAVENFVGGLEGAAELAQFSAQLSLNSIGKVAFESTGLDVFRESALAFDTQAKFISDTVDNFSEVLLAAGGAIVDDYVGRYNSIGVNYKAGDYLQAGYDAGYLFTGAVSTAVGVGALFKVATTGV